MLRIATAVSSLKQVNAAEGGSTSHSVAAHSFMETLRESGLKLLGDPAKESSTELGTEREPIVQGSKMLKAPVGNPVDLLDEKESNVAEKTMTDAPIGSLAGMGLPAEKSTSVPTTSIDSGKISDSTPKQEVSGIEVVGKDKPKPKPNVGEAAHVTSASVPTDAVSGSLLPSSHVAMNSLSSDLQPASQIDQAAVLQENGPMLQAAVVSTQVRSRDKSTSAKVVASSAQVLASGHLEKGAGAIQSAVVSPSSPTGNAKDVSPRTIEGKDASSAAEVVVVAGKTETSLGVEGSRISHPNGTDAGGQNSLWSGNVETKAGQIFVAGAEGRAKVDTALSSQVAGNSNGYGIQDRVSYEGLPTGDHGTSRATATSLEVGFSSDTHGWLKVRADMEGGAVTASIASTTSAGREALHRELPSMTAYLQDEKIALSGLVIKETSAPSASNSDQSTAMGGQGRSGQQGYEGKENNAATASGDVAFGASDEDAMSEVWNSVEVGTGLLRTTTNSSGNWLNVRV